MARMRMKKLEEYLSGVDGFQNPKIKLEQYPTPPHIASCILYNVQAQFSDLEGKLVGDLGCGCGMLSIGSFLLGSQLTIGFELDPDAIDVFRYNVNEMELPAIDCVQTDVLELSGTKWENVFDTIVTNPPFGTKHNAGMDMQFIETAIHLATAAVYSLHKTSTRDYILKKSKDWKVRGEVVAQLKYNIDNSYKFHKNKSVDIEVDFWRFDVTEKEL
ncbi:rRNA N6-adenosine-methyltransferase Mettl5 [Stomoxys calcitrans]|uniref:Methyltransferase-like protein 5 n=1 Tax=Stomoxys calcitrans TaxID=35570 RepID=A0A1I8PEM2_STOCA|nr:rRNA N6-adenosine-methyltransferase Mettl5 [Stomoxys calcitrans]